MSNCEEPTPSPMVLEDGVALSLAQQRADQLEDVRYKLFFNIPAELSAPIPASLEVQFSLKDTEQAVTLDFRADSSQVIGVRQAGQPVAYRFEKDHIIIPSSALSVGQNTFQIKFTAGDQSLNRSEEYLYTLFVPDRAATAFPCFDQPDIKAKYTLEMEVPLSLIHI